MRVDTTAELEYRRQAAFAKEVLRRLEDAYGIPPRRPHHDPVAELVLTILSQNTSDANSGRAFVRLMDRFADWDAVAEAPPEQIEDAIRPGGLAPTKAPRIAAALREVRERTGGFDLSFLSEMPLEEARRWLTSIDGVGPKTAACVLLFALGRPAMPVDTHVHRVSQRLGLIPPKATAEQAHAILEAIVPPADVFPLHMSLVKHGRRTCIAGRPRCPECPLNDICPSAYPGDGDGRKRR